MWGYDQDTLGYLREVAPRCPPCMQVPEVSKDLLEVAPWLRFISIPWLVNARVFVLDILDEREEPYIICDYG